MGNTYFVYALISEINNRIYVGFTGDVEKRLKEHNSGKTKSTKGYRPWKLLYFEEASTRVLARQKEKYYKSGIGKEFLKSLLHSSTDMNTCLPAGRGVS